MSRKHDVNALLRKDLALFIERTFRQLNPGAEYLDNWHIRAIAHALARCLSGECTRLIITMPPRYLKSISSSVAFPAWILGHDPSCNIIAASYAQDLSTKHHNDTRRVMESAWYKNCFPNTRIDPKKNTQSDFRTTCNGGRFATSVGGTLTGLGGNFIIIDDPHKTDEVESETKRENVIEWFRGSILTRLNNKKKDVIIVIQQRQHESDLAGYLLESAGWEHVNLPAIAEEEQIIAVDHDETFHRQPGDILHPEREDLVLLEKMRSTMGSYAFAAQYQQTPTPKGGELIQWEWFGFYDPDRNNLPPGRIIQSWDTAHTLKQTSDYSVCVTLLCAKEHIYVLDVYRKRMLFPELKKKVIQLAHNYDAYQIIIEGTNSGIDLQSEIALETRLFIRYSKPTGDKISRMVPCTSLIESGRVLLPKNARWLAEFQREMVLFPNSNHDDQVDALSQGLRNVRAWYIRRRTSSSGSSSGGPAPSFTARDVFTMSIY